MRLARSFPRRETMLVFWSFGPLIFSSTCWRWFWCARRKQRACSSLSLALACSLKRPTPKVRHLDLDHARVCVRKKREARATHPLACAVRPAPVVICCCSQVASRRRLFLLAAALLHTVVRSTWQAIDGWMDGEQVGVRRARLFRGFLASLAGVARAQSTTTFDDGRTTTTTAAARWHSRQRLFPSRCATRVVSSFASFALLCLLAMLACYACLLCSIDRFSMSSGGHQQQHQQHLHSCLFAFQQGSTSSSPYLDFHLASSLILVLILPQA